MLFDRVFLASLILGIWAVIKLIEELLPDRALNYLPKPLAVYTVIIFVVAMIIYSIWLVTSCLATKYLNVAFESQAIYL